MLPPCSRCDSIHEVQDSEPGTLYVKISAQASLEPSGNCQNLFNTLNIFTRKKNLFFFLALCFLYVSMQLLLSSTKPNTAASVFPPHLQSNTPEAHAQMYTSDSIRQTWGYCTSGHFAGTQLTRKCPIYNLNVLQ